MPTENELKYLLVNNCEEEIRKDFGPATYITQGYFKSDNCTVRIRKESGPFQPSEYLLTFKKYCVNRLVEIETSIDLKDYMSLMFTIEDLIVKKRYSHNLGDELWSVDFFEFPTYLDGLVIAEVEMPEEREKPNHIPPSIKPFMVSDEPLGKEYSNYNLINRLVACPV